MDAIKTAFNVKANEYRQQELLGSIVAATVIGFGSKYVSQLPTKTIAAAALNGFGLAVSAKSVGTIYSNWSKTNETTDKDAIAARNSAKKALMASVLIMTATTLLRATNFADTKFSAAPVVNAHLKPLLAASAGTAVLSEMGLYTVKSGSAFLERRAKEKEIAAKLKAHNALVAELVKHDEGAVKQLNADAIAEVAADLKKVIAFDKEEKSLDELIGWVNAQAGVLGIKDWENIVRASV
jgi:antitoxin component of RelBE/YafQ-DinJ toxin-antitoxin module